MILEPEESAELRITPAVLCSDQAPFEREQRGVGILWLACDLPNCKSRWHALCIPLSSDPSVRDAPWQACGVMEHHTSKDNRRRGSSPRSSHLAAAMWRGDAEKPGPQEGQVTGSSHLPGVFLLLILLCVLRPPPQLHYGLQCGAS